MSFNDLLPPDRSRSPSPNSSKSTTSASTSSKATPPHLRNLAFMRQRSTTPSPTRLSTATTLVGSMSGQANRIGDRLGFTPRHSMPINRRNNIRNPLELRVYLAKVPRSWTTWDLHRFFKPYGNLSRIEIYERRTQDARAVVMFRPAPPNYSSWVGRPLPVYDPEGFQRVIETRNDTKPMYWYSSPNVKRQLPERMTLPLHEVGFGVMQEEDKMLVLHTAESTSSAIPNIHVTMNMQFKELYLFFPVEIQNPSTGKLLVREFKLRITPAQIWQAFLLFEHGAPTIVLSIDAPPLAFRRTINVQGTHDSEATLWDERKTWFRQTDIDINPIGPDRKTPVQLRKKCIIEVGRWLTYRLRFNKDTAQSAEFRDLVQALADHNVNLISDRTVKFNFHEDHESLWSWAARDKLGGESLSGMLELVDESTHLPFPLQYQLEVCLSLGVLHECNMDRLFLQRLANIDPLRAVKVLEKAADDKKRFYDPVGVLRLQNRVSVIEKKRPGYCTRIPSVTITPTTMYFSTPVLETSNRVIRQYQRHEDRFLRVRFTDERYKGKLFSADDSSLNELFSRVKRTMTHGIKIGDRHYEFLAFGNSQFRDHGAYFFASTADTTAAMIRDWMGDFTSIQVIAKYVSRLGQCFSTTRAIPHSVQIEEIPDVERNGYCFTDGVGKISPFLAQMIAHHFGQSGSDQNYPSVFQFRLAGCKGVLAVDPTLRGKTIQIRPSQNKFPAKFQGLEICRMSQYNSASLNVQIILVLSALGVPDEIFLGKLRNMLTDLQEAMEGEQKALELLQKNIDYNQMTIVLACMIFAGFMETKDPFMVSCLRLWRSWSLKYLKEKARIFVDQGAFPLGATDESRTLRGHFDDADALQGDETALPEIFLQIPDADKPGSYKVVEGICILARNPSLHPGDIRVVLAVDKPVLYHYKNCVILPQTGDRDLANMCSGGDLDGDDYLVIWDKDLIPPEWNHPPMDYISPPPVMAKGPVTVDDMTSFFVQHIKNDILSKIAVNHRYWADQLLDGVKDPKCVELAQLHSKAVDYPKTGVPATMGPGLRVPKWPHWSEQKNKAQSKIYRSEKVIGKLYDEVKKEPFHAAWDFPFDNRVLMACNPSEQMLKDAKEVKQLYDDAMQRIMTQYGIQTEFEVYTTFVLEHHQEIGDYKLAEAMGEVTGNLKQHHQDICYERAGTTPVSKNWDVMKPFIVAMYQVTADEVAEALAETKSTRHVGGREVPLRALNFESMPLMSFPWLFATELGRIATNGNAAIQHKAMPKPNIPAKTAAKSHQLDLLGDDFVLPDLSEVNTSTGVIHEGEVLDLFASKENSRPIVVVSDVPKITIQEPTPVTPVSGSRSSLLFDADVVISETMQPEKVLERVDEVIMVDAGEVVAKAEESDTESNKICPASKPSEVEVSVEAKAQVDAGSEAECEYGEVEFEEGEVEFEEGEVEFEGMITERAFAAAKQNPLDRLAELVGLGGSSD